MDDLLTFVQVVGNLVFPLFGIWLLLRVPSRGGPWHGEGSGA